MRNLLLIWLVFLLACSSAVDKKAIDKADSLNDMPIKIVFKIEPSASKYDYEKNLENDTILKKGVPEQLRPFGGSWIRTDFLDTLLKTKSTAQTLRKVDGIYDILSFNATNDNYGEDTLMLMFSINGYHTGVPGMLFVRYNVQRELNGYPLYDTNSNTSQNSSKYWLSMLGKQLQIIHLDKGNYTKKLYTKTSNNLSIFGNIIEGVIAKIIIGKYDLLDKNNKIIKKSIYFNDVKQTNFPEFKDYSFWSPHSIEKAPAVGERHFREEQDEEAKNNKQDTAKARQKWIERYIKRGALTDEDILFLGNEKYGSYFAVKYVKDTFLLYPLNKTDQIFGRIGNIIYKKKLYYKLVVNNKL